MFFMCISARILFANDYSKIETIYSYTESDLFKNQEQIEELIKNNDVKTIVEIGPYLGESTIFMAKQLPSEGKIYAVDSWIGYPIEHYELKRNFYKKFLSNIIHAGCTEIVIPVHKTSLTASKTFSEYEKVVDMIYIDADHSYKAVYSDILAWSPYLHDEGILCGNLFSKFGETSEIKRAVIDFCKKFDKSPTFSGHLWVIK